MKTKVKLTDLCDIQYGYAFDSAKFTDDEAYVPLVRIRDVKRGFSETYYSGEYSCEYILHAGELLIGMDGEFNIARWKSRAALLNQRVCKVSAKEGVCEEYLRFALSGKLKEIENRTSFATVKHLSAKELNKLELDIPELIEQERISEALAIIEGIIEKREKELEKFDELIKARFVELFGDLHNTIFTKCKMGEICDIKHGYAFSGEFFTEEDNNTLLVTPGNFKVGGGFQEKKCKFFSGEYSKEYVLNSGDLIVTMTDLSKNMDTLGYSAIVPSKNRVYLHNQRIGLFVNMSEKINNVFLMYFMQTNEYRDRILASATGSTVHHTSPAKILDCDVFVPPIKIQEQFAAFVERVDKSKVEVQKALDEAQLLMDSLMQKYFG